VKALPGIFDKLSDVGPPVKAAVKAAVAAAKGAKSGG
jgi:hypothetical protein